MAQTGTQTIGWQGITVDAPLDWSLTGFGGDARAGTLRLDGGDPDVKAMPIGLEVRWIEHNKPQNEAQLQARLKPLLKSVERTAKRQRMAFETSSGPVTGNRTDDRPAEIAFRWKAGDAGNGRIWFCATCGRVIIVQAYGAGGPKFNEAAGRLLSTIGCHGNEVGWRIWALYGMLTGVPADYSLAGQQVMNIYLLLRFQKTRAQDTLTVEQWSLANVQLKERYLDDWFEEKAGHSLSNVQYEKCECDVHGHSALALSGRRRGVMYWVSGGLREILRFRIPATHYAAVLWECPDSNKTYLVQSYTRRKQPELLGEIANRTVCHAQ